MSMMVSFRDVFFPRDVLDEIWDLIESVHGFFLPTLPILHTQTLHKWVNILECLCAVFAYVYLQREQQN